MKKKWKNRIKTLFQTKQVYAELGFGILILNLIYVPLLSSSFHASLFTSFLGGPALALLTMMPIYISEVFWEKESRFDKKKEKQKTHHFNQENKKEEDYTNVKANLLALTHHMKRTVKEENTFMEGLQLLKVLLEIIKAYKKEKEVLDYIQQDIIKKLDSILVTYDRMNKEKKLQATIDLKQLFQRKRIELTDCYLKQKEEQLQQTFEKQIKELEESKYEYVYLEE